MDIKMLSLFMISRLLRIAPVVLVAAAIAFVSACEKVPLFAPAGSIITITAASTALPTSGTTQIIVQVLEQSGTPPHSGTHIIFTTTLGTVQPPEVETDVNGRAVV